MPRVVRDVDRMMREAARDSFTQRLLLCEKSDESTLTERRLSRTQTKVLAKRILPLPDEGKDILFGIYGMSQSFGAVSRLFGIASVRGKWLYYTRLLSVAEGLPQGELISDASLKRGSFLAMRMYLFEICQYHTPKPVVVRQMLRLAAAILITVFIGAGSVLGVNAKLRETVVQWFVTLFEEYGIYRVETDKGADTLLRKEYHLNYIPEGYRLKQIDEDANVKSYTYVSSDADSSLDVIINYAKG